MLPELAPQNVINIVLFLKNEVILLLIRFITSLFVQTIRRFTCVMCFGTKLDGYIWLSNGKTFDVVWHFVRSSECWASGNITRREGIQASLTGMATKWISSIVHTPFLKVATCGYQPCRSINQSILYCACGCGAVWYRGLLLRSSTANSPRRNRTNSAESKRGRKQLALSENIRTKMASHECTFLDIVALLVRTPMTKLLGIESSFRDAYRVGLWFWEISEP